jgi:DNA repair exonuclease SbcCD nuclease subunit
LFDHDARVVLLPEGVPQGDCVFACLPWAPTSRLAAGGGQREEVNSQAVEALILSAQAMRVRCESEYPGLTPVLVGHWAVSGSSLPAGMPVDQLQEPVLPWDAVDDLGFKIAAFGHIHQPQLIAAGVSNNPLFYVGSTMVCNWGEAGFAHGVWVFDSVADDLAFHEIEDRKFLTLNAGEGEQPDVKDAIVRVSYTTTENDSVDEADLRWQLLDQGAARVTIKGTVERASRARMQLPDDDVDPSAALDLWIKHNDVWQEGVPVLRERHAHYLKETM